MSSVVFPNLAGIGWMIKRAPLWKTRVQESISGKETRIADWSFPRWQWELSYEMLRQGTLSGSAYAELAQLAGFFNARQGAFDTWLYQDPDDNAVTAQPLGIGDGATTAFQLVRAFGGYVEPVTAPNIVAAVRLNGVVQSAGSYAVSAWGAAAPGVVTFTTAPGSGVAVSADFSYYFPCRFVDDTLDFEKFMASIYALKKITFRSVK